MKQSKFTDHKFIIIERLAPDKLQSQRLLKEYVALSLLDLYFLFNNFWLIQVWIMNLNCLKKSKGDQLKELQYETERHDYE